MTFLQKIEQPIAVFSEFRAQLGQLREANEKAVFDYEDPKGNKEARSHIYKLRQTKSAVEKARKDQKAAALEYGRVVDSEAKEISSEIQGMIDIHHKPLEEIEQREARRVADLKDGIQEMHDTAEQIVAGWAEMPIADMRNALSRLENTPITREHWHEFVEQAAESKDAVLTKLRQTITDREKHDAEQAELARLRQEAEERERKDREERRAAEEKRRQDEAVERARKQAEEAAEREREEAAKAADRREMELRLAAERAERERLEADRRAERAQEAAEARAKAQREAEERQAREDAERRERNKKHRQKVDGEVISALTAGGLSPNDAGLVLDLLRGRKVPHVSLSY